MYEKSHTEFRNAFLPLQDTECKITLAGAPLLTGTLLNGPPILAEAATISAGGYSLPGVLQSSAILLADPKQFKMRNLDFTAISQRLLRPHGIGGRYTGPVGPRFKNISIKQSDLSSQ